MIAVPSCDTLMVFRAAGVPPSNSRFVRLVTVPKNLLPVLVPLPPRTKMLANVLFVVLASSKPTGLSTPKWTLLTAANVSVAVIVSLASGERISPYCEGRPDCVAPITEIVSYPPNPVKSLLTLKFPAMPLKPRLLAAPPPMTSLPAFEEIGV